MSISLLSFVALALQLQQPVPAAQGVDYRIEARLDDASGILEARMELTYANRSEVSIDTLWFHQHLNAFRPNSAWARRELEFGIRRFQDLGPEEYAFGRLGAVQVGGRTATPVYPGAPDSTVVGIPLPQRLDPGEQVVVHLDWTARPSTLPRRQGRAGRHLDFAQWYPRIAVFEDGEWTTQPLLPQGEFYGEFASYDVTLDLAADQVIGSTGVIVEGDPGWSDAAEPGVTVPAPSAAYAAEPAKALGLLSGEPPPGRRRVRIRAERVHHFAWSVDPDFRYEGGFASRTDGGDPIPVHVLYWPDDRDWAEGVALGRTIRALEWLQDRFGPYPWPQLTNLHRVEPGGTEFPMLVMNGSPSEGLIVHEVTHQYLHGILANNEFREGWLDEGFASYLTNRYFEESGNSAIWEASLRAARAAERAGIAQPIGLPAAEFRDYETYGAMTYTKAELVLRMLEGLIGEQAMRVVLRELYSRHALSHYGEQEFRQVVEDVTSQELDWFFDQWIHSTATLDYAVTAATSQPAAGGGWVTRVEVTRTGDAWMPVLLNVGSQQVELDSRERVQTVELTTSERPTEVVLDPANLLLDLDPDNNRAVPAVSTP